MRFHELDISRIDPMALVNLPLQPRLRRRIRGGNAVGLAVLVHPPAANHPVNPIPIALRVRQALQHHHPNRFSRHKSIGPMVKGKTAPLP